MTAIRIRRMAVSLLSVSDSGESLSSIARALDSSKTSLLTLLARLAKERYITGDERSLYRIGPTGFSLAVHITGGVKLPGLVRPALQRLMLATGETALAGVLSPLGDSVVYIEKAENLNPMRHTVGVGTHRELHCTALGKLVLA